MTAGAAVAEEGDELVLELLASLPAVLVADASQLTVADVELEPEPEVEVETLLWEIDELCETEELEPSVVLVCEHEQLTVPEPELVTVHGASEDGGAAVASPPRPRVAAPTSIATPALLHERATPAWSPLVNTASAPSPRVLSSRCVHRSS